jgi:RNA polymerase sigma-70 factor, ECF subfamily
VTTLTPEDADLIDRYLSGDRHALETLDDWIAQASWPFKRRLVWQWEDVLQDTRLEVTRLLQRGTFRGEASLKTYVWRVVNNTCLDKLRVARRWQWTDLEDLTKQLGAPVVEPPRAAGDAETKDLLMRVLARMSSECRKLWAMVLAGLSYRQMSRRLEIGEGALRVRVLRCRKRAQAVRDELEGGDGAEA